MNTPILTTHGLGARAGTHTLLDGVNIELHPGRVLGVVGESGSGKTTLGIALRGEHADGVELTGSVRPHRAESCTVPQLHTPPGFVGYLPQHPGSVLNPARRVGKVLSELAAFNGHRRGERDQVVRRALREARLDPDPRLLRRYPHQLSGGQQQRVALAQLLINRPAVLVLDEPTTGLDTATKAEMATTLAGLAHSGTALVLLTHELGLARQLAHEVLVLLDGRVVEHGPGTRPLHAPVDAHSRALLAAEPHLPGRNPTSHEPRTRGDEAPVLLAERLGKKGRDGTPVLADVDLSLTRGHCVAIAGRSGAGKTTLARCIAGLTRPDTGRVLLDGIPLPDTVQQRDRQHRRRVQYVHQNARASFDEGRPIDVQVARTARLLLGTEPGTAAREARDMLALLGLTCAQTKRRPRDLSGGQLQRAALARALLARPDVLICDEITSALDMVNQADLLGILTRAMSTTRTSLVLISHDLAMLSSVADEIHILDNGRCVESAVTTHLIEQPRSAAAKALVTTARRDAHRPDPSTVEVNTSPEWTY